MTATPPVIEAADAFLDRLARLDLQAAEHVHACLLDTIKPAEVAELARAYGRVSRGLRQTLALHSKLKIDRERAAREAARHDVANRPSGGGYGSVSAFDPRAHAIDARADDVRDAVERVISKAADGDEARHTQIAHRFDREMDDWVEAEDFLDLNVEAHIQEACRRLGLPADLSRAWRTLPEPTFFPDPEEWSDEDDEEDDATLAEPGLPAPSQPPGEDTFPPPTQRRDTG